MWRDVFVTLLVVLFCFAFWMSFEDVARGELTRAHSIMYSGSGLSRTLTMRAESLPAEAVVALGEADGHGHRFGTQDQFELWTGILWDRESLVLIFSSSLAHFEAYASEGSEGGDSDMEEARCGRTSCNR